MYPGSPEALGSGYPDEFPPVLHPGAKLLKGQEVGVSRRRPMMSPPGGGSSTTPNLAVMGAARRMDALMFRQRP